MIQFMRRTVPRGAPSFAPSINAASVRNAWWLSGSPRPYVNFAAHKSPASGGRPAADKLLERSRQRGQGMTEYLIVVALISVAAIGVYSFFGQTLRNQTAGIALELAGQDAASAVNQAQTAASQAQTLAGQRRGLENYGGGNR
jgi:Flp pilus assembly pilin Flp